MEAGAAVEPHGGACGARTRSRGVCSHPAGWGTDHPGQGRCKLHGGATPVRHGRYSTIKRPELRELIERHRADPDPLNLLDDLAALRGLVEDYINRYDDTTAALLAWHESYRAVERPITESRLLEVETVIDELEALVGPADLDEEDQEEDGARVRRAIRKARELVDDLRKPDDDGGKPRQMMDLADAYRMLDAVGKMVKRIEDIRAQNAISRPELLRIMQEMGRVVARYVGDEETREKIQDAWLQIRA